MKEGREERSKKERKDRQSGERTNAKKGLNRKDERESGDGRKDGYLVDYWSRHGNSHTKTMNSVAIE